jgi:MFS family permease
MYTLIRENLAVAGGRVRPPRAFARPIGRTVLLLGLTSLITDISSEMVTTVLPLYFVLHLQLSPLKFGVIDGLYQGLSAPLRLLGGLAADRWRWHKGLAATGYGVSAICKLGLVFAGGGWAPVTGVLMADRAGKGIRTAPRDALISMNAAPDSLGTAFGVHRAMDTLGALLGPLLAFALLTLTPGAFDNIFVVSFCIALIGVGVIVLFVDGAERHRELSEAPRLAMREVLAQLRRPYFVRLVLLACGLGLFTISDGFLYLVLQRQLDFRLGLFPLLYVGTALAYFALAIPSGWMADRFGRHRILILGYLALLLTYTALLRQPGGDGSVVLYLLLFGAYYAATDGVLMAMASAELPENVRTTGLAVLATAISLSRFAGSVMFGFSWTTWGSGTALSILLVGLITMIAVAVPVLGRKPEVANAN